MVNETRGLGASERGGATGRRRQLLFAAAALLAASAASYGMLRWPGSARAAASVYVNAGTQNEGTAGSGSKTTVDVTIAGLEGDTKFKDFHIYCPSNKKLDNPGQGNTIEVVPRDAPSSAQQWKMKKSSDGKALHIYSGDKDGFGNGTFRIVIDWPKGREGDVGGCSWEATKDGNVTDDSDDGIGASGSGSTMLDLPVLTVRANNGNPKALGIGTTSPLPCQSMACFGGMEFALYSSTELDEEYADPLAIGIRTAESPVPPAWGLTFTGWSGTLDPTGSPLPVPTISVPNQPALTGHRFYVVFAILQSGSVLHASDPIEVTIE